MPEQKILFWLGVFCIALTAFRINWLYLVNLPLYGDEAQYWVWSQDLAFGYYSKPPVIAWLIRLATTIFGDYEASIRIISPLFHLGTTYFIYKIASHLYGKNIAFWSAFTYISLPSVFLSSILASTDAPLMFFWASSLYFYILAIADDKLKHWVMLGICSGLGLLTKYSMAIFAFSVLAHIIINQKYNIFKNKNFWIGAGIAGALFSTNLIWNFANGFPSFSHTYDLAQGRPNERFLPLNGVLFFIAQAVMIGPILFPILLYGIRQQGADILKVFTFVFLGIIILLSFYSRAHANWAAPAYVAGTILAVVVIACSKYKNLIKASIMLHCFIGLGSMLYLTFDDLQNRNTPLGRIYVPFELTNKYFNNHHDISHKTLVFDDRMMLSVFKYYLRGMDINFVKWNPNHAVRDHFDLTTDLNDHAREDVVVLSGWLTENVLEEYAKEVEKLGTVSSSEGYGRRSRILKVYNLEDFHGY